MSVMKTIFLAVLFLLAAAVPAPAWAELRIALVIGNGAYEAVPRLSNPPSDAAAVAARLRALGFQVTEGIDLGKTAMDRTVRQFGELAGQADVAVVFYAGHGIQVSGRNYLVPVDAKLPTREQDLRYDFVDVAAVMDELAGVRRLRVVVLDACRDNPIAVGLNRSLGRGIAASRGLAVPTGMDNTLIAYATAADATASDGSGANSPFTQALLAHIGDPGLDVRLMFGRVRDEVRRATNNQQNPFVYVSMGGESFSFNAGPPVGDTGVVQALPPAVAGATEAQRPLTAFVVRPRAQDVEPVVPPAPLAVAPLPVAPPGPVAPQSTLQPQAPVQPPVAPPSGQAVFYAQENVEFGVRPQTMLRSDVGTATPTSIPGARTVSTAQVMYEVRQNRRMVLVDALENVHAQTIAGAVHLPTSGRSGSFSDGFQSQLARDLSRLTQGQRDMPVVFFCQGVRCWESYNAALRARAAGFQNVFWYRGGLQSWAEAGLPMWGMNGR